MSKQGSRRPGIDERDADICRLYKGNDKTPGCTLEQLADRFNLSRERVRQIVKAGGLISSDRFKFDNPKDQFLGLNVTTKVKIALKQEASKRGISVSSLSTPALKKMLAELGYDVGAA